MTCPKCQGPATEEMLREFGGVCPKCLLHFAEEQDAPVFPSLEIVEMVGQGGMGVVYKAVQKSLGRTVALKVLSPQLSSDPEFVERFTREAKALAQLNHPNIVAIYDSGIHDKVPYLVMEYVEGQSLRQLLASKQLTAPQALELVPQICDALYYAHSKGVVHRDIKPENILLDAAGRVKIADYGLAKIASLDQPRITKSNIAMGTPHYMAPEQIEKTSEVDHRADIYSLGVVIYEMLTGELPLGRFKPPSERAQVDRRVDQVVFKSLEKEPADRYQSADEVKSQIANLKKPDPPAGSEAARLSRLAVTSGVLCLCGLATALAAIVVLAYGNPYAGGTAFAVAGACWFASMAVSIAAFFVILLSNNRLRGMWIPITSGISSLLLLLISLVGMVAPSAPAPTTPTPAGAGSQLPGGAEWPEHFVLPKGFSLVARLTGEEAIRASGFPLELAADTSRVQYARLSPGDAEVLYLRFRSKELEDTWKHKAEDRWRPGGGAPGEEWLYSTGSIDLDHEARLMLAVHAAGDFGTPPRARGPGFRLAEAWPTIGDLPSYWKYGKVLEGKAALGFPEMLPDLALVRRWDLDGGVLTLMGYEFKTEEARDRWEKKLGFIPVMDAEARFPAGRAFFTVTPNSVPGRDWLGDFMTGDRRLKDILKKKMAAARDR